MTHPFHAAVSFAVFTSVGRPWPVLEAWKGEVFWSGSEVPCFRTAQRPLHDLRTG